MNIRGVLFLFISTYFQSGKNKSGPFVRRITTTHDKLLHLLGNDECQFPASDRMATSLEMYLLLITRPILELQKPEKWNVGM